MALMETGTPQTNITMGTPPTPVLPTNEILAKLNKNSMQNKDEIFTRLYRYLLRTDIWFKAYKNLYANNGAATKGVDDDTADGFSVEKIERIIKSLASETYQPKPLRRTYILKANGKKRPLGIPTFTDKLVQEALRMVLEAIYEPIFLNCSHGFRPNKSCHTALVSLKNEFTGAKWFVEGDIKGCFDNINHDVLIGIVNKKVKDARIINLLYKFLKSGHIENWQYHKTYSGTPQGGIISPLLANIYLHELDKFVMELKSKFDKPNLKPYRDEYMRARAETYKIKGHIEKADGELKKELLEEYKKSRQQLLKTPYTPQENKSLKYVRYADDFLIAVKGDREDCEEIKRKLTEFIGGKLKMELSEEKTLITHSSNYARFLGYDLRIRRNGAVKPHGQATQRTLNGSVELCIPFNDKIHKFLFSKNIVIQKDDGSMFPVSRSELLGKTELEIITTFNAELRGICNYYSLACNFYKLNYFSYLMEYSCLKTLANKHKSSVGKIRSKYRRGKNAWAIPYSTKSGERYMHFAKYSECKTTEKVTDIIDTTALYGYNRNSFDKRLNAKVCELCGTMTAEHYEIHHVNKVKNLKGKADWERAMIARNRKTLVVCLDCHHKIHNQKSSI